MSFLQDTNTQHSMQGEPCNTVLALGLGVGGEKNRSNKRVSKKLRLSKEQSNLLEESFKEHKTLNPTQKQELADCLDLRPRQVEVWFQNRRARTKFKRTEVEYELLKKWCESLRNENRRLKEELQELRSVKPESAFYVQLPKVATASICTSCDRTWTRSPLSQKYH